MVTQAPALRAWLTAFVFTQIIEVPIYWQGLSCSVLAAFGASAITHPVVWFVFFAPCWRGAYWGRVVASEAFAWLAEAAYFRFLWRKRRALLWSAVANAASFSLGLLGRQLLGVP